MTFLKNTELVFAEKEPAKLITSKLRWSVNVKARFLRVSYWAVLLLFPLSSRLHGAEDVDLIFLNGNIYTVDERQPHAEAVAVRKDRIAFVGASDDARKLANEKNAPHRSAWRDRRSRPDRFALPHFWHRRARNDFESRRHEHARRFSRQSESARESDGIRQNGSPVAAGSKLSGNRPHSRRAKNSTRSRRIIRYSSNGPTVTPRSQILEH